MGKQPIVKDDFKDDSNDDSIIDFLITLGKSSGWQGNEMEYKQG